MVYLLDANVLITAHQSYYPVDAVPQFWDWLATHAAAGEIKMPLETFEEIKDGPPGEKDLLFAWLQDDGVKSALILGEEPNERLVQQVLSFYGDNLADDELEQIGRDPFLIAYALGAPADRCVVTTEASRPSTQRANRRIPDVCRDVGVQCCNTFKMTHALRFTTG